MKIPAWIPARYEDWINTFPAELREAARSNRDALAADAFAAWVWQHDTHGVITVEQIFAALGWSNWTIRAADLSVKHIHRVVTAEVGTDEGIYHLAGLIVWITLTEDQVRIGVSERPDGDTGEWEFSHGDLVTIEAGK